MGKSPIAEMLDAMFAKLDEALVGYREAEKSVKDLSGAIEAVAKLCEDEELRDEYLLRLEELTGKQSFVAAIRHVMTSGAAMTPTQIKQMIDLTGKMNLKGYVNPMASIHTTLRRMKDAGDIKETTNSKGEKAYAITLVGRVRKAHTDVPNPYGKNLSEMLKETKKK